MPAERKRSSFAFWATIVVLLVVLYVASFGPACWIACRFAGGGQFVAAAFRPILWLCERPSAENSFLQIDNLLTWYANAGVGDDRELFFIRVNGQCRVISAADRETRAKLKEMLWAKAQMRDDDLDIRFGSPTTRSH